MYNGLTTADKGALLDAKAAGKTHLDLPHTNCNWNIDLALAQIAEMEREKPDEDEIKTIYGYPVQELALIAVLMRDHGITVEEVHKAAMNWSFGAEMAFTAAQQQIDVGLKKSIETMRSPYTNDDESNPLRAGEGEIV